MGKRSILCLIEHPEDYHNRRGQHAKPESLQEMRRVAELVKKRFDSKKEEYLLPSIFSSLMTRSIQGALEFDKVFLRGTINQENRLWSDSSEVLTELYEDIKGFPSRFKIAIGHADALKYFPRLFSQEFPNTPKDKLNTWRDYCQGHWYDLETGEVKLIPEDL